MIWAGWRGARAVEMRWSQDVGIGGIEKNETAIRGQLILIFRRLYSTIEYAVYAAFVTGAMTAPVAWTDFGCFGRVVGGANVQVNAVWCCRCRRPLVESASESNTSARAWHVTEQVCDARIARKNGAVSGF